MKEHKKIQDKKFYQASSFIKKIYILYTNQRYGAKKEDTIELKQFRFHSF